MAKSLSVRYLCIAIASIGFSHATRATTSQLQDAPLPGSKMLQIAGRADAKSEAPSDALSFSRVAELCVQEVAHPPPVQRNPKTLEKIGGGVSEDCQALVDGVKIIREKYDSPVKVRTKMQDHADPESKGSSSVFECAQEFSHPAPAVRNPKTGEWFSHGGLSDDCKTFADSLKTIRKLAVYYCWDHDCDLTTDGKSKAPLTASLTFGDIAMEMSECAQEFSQIPKPVSEDCKTLMEALILMASKTPLTAF